ncbi:MAG: hypothetical protein K0V04_30180 [Deltaproteobacteria bacterium]|nr:hypothetical protein [Deltaproteobacteria bacterium]
MHAREALCKSFARVTPYADDVTVMARPEITYWKSPRPAAVLNTVRMVQAAESEVPRLVEEVVRAHRGGPSSWYVQTEGGPLSEALASAGYAPSYRAQGYWIGVDQPGPAASEIVVERVETMAQLAQFFHIDAVVFGEGAPVDEREYAATARVCFGDDAQLRCFVAYRSAASREPISCGRLYMFPELEFGLLQASATLPHARGLGGYRALLAARIAYAREHGLPRVGLYAMEGTSAPIVARQGFRPCGSLVNWGARCAAVRAPRFPRHQ